MSENPTPAVDVTKADPLVEKKSRFKVKNIATTGVGDEVPVAEPKLTVEMTDPSQTTPDERSTGPTVQTPSQTTPSHKPATTVSPSNPVSNVAGNATTVPVAATTASSVQTSVLEESSEKKITVPKKSRFIVKTVSRDDDSNVDNSLYSAGLGGGGTGVLLSSSLPSIGVQHDAGFANHSGNNAQSASGQGQYVFKKPGPSAVGHALGISSTQSDAHSALGVMHHGSGPVVGPNGMVTSSHVNVPAQGGMWPMEQYHQTAIVQRLEQLLEMNSHVLTKMMEHQQLHEMASQGALPTHHSSQHSQASQPLDGIHLNSRNRGNSDEMQAATLSAEHVARSTGSNHINSGPPINGTTRPPTNNSAPTKVADSSGISGGIANQSTTVSPSSASSHAVSTSHSPNPSSHSANQAAEKEKSFGKLSYFVGEMKKEIDLAQKSKKDAQLEMQLLREKCQSLEERLNVELNKVASLEERLEKAKTVSKQLAAQVESQQAIIDHQNSLIAFNQSQASAMHPMNSSIQQSQSQGLSGMVPHQIAPQAQLQAQIPQQLQPFPMSQSSSHAPAHMPTIANGPPSHPTNSNGPPPSQPHRRLSGTGSSLSSLVDLAGPASFSALEPLVSMTNTNSSSISQTAGSVSGFASSPATVLPSPAGHVSQVAPMSAVPSSGSIAIGAMGSVSLPSKPANPPPSNMMHAFPSISRTPSAPTAPSNSSFGMNSSTNTIGSSMSAGNPSQTSTIPSTISTGLFVDIATTPTAATSAEEVRSPLLTHS